MASQPYMSPQRLPKWRIDPKWVAVPLVFAAGVFGAAVEIRALEAERDQLSTSLAGVRTEQLRDRERMRQLEAQFASYKLNTVVRREVVTERMTQQEQRATALAAEAEAVRLQKLAEANCFTPKSILDAVGL